MSCSPELEIEDCEEAETPPCLPSVRELAVRFQPRKSPEPKPRRSLLKKKAAERLQKSAAASAYQVHSLTARSVPRAFRDGLRRGGGVARDHIGAHAAKEHVGHRGPNHQQVLRREVLPRSTVGSLQCQSSSLPEEHLPSRVTRVMRAYSSLGGERGGWTESVGLEIYLP